MVMFNPAPMWAALWNKSNDRKKRLEFHLFDVAFHTSHKKTDADIDHIEYKLTGFFHRAALFGQIISKEVQITVGGKVNH